MTSFLSRAASDSRVQLVATAVASGAAVAGAILGYQALAREERVQRLKDSIPYLPPSAEAAYSLKVSENRPRCRAPAARSRAG